MRRIAGYTMRQPRTVVAAAGLIAAVVAALVGTDWGATYLWMSALGHPEVFWTIRSVKVGAFLSAGVPVFLYIWANARGLARRSDVFRLLLQPRGPAGNRFVRLAPVAVALFGAIIAGFAFYSSWDMAVRWLHGPATGAPDPVYGRDLGFHLFTRPLLDFLSGWLLVVTSAVAGLVLAGYVYAGTLAADPRHSAPARSAMRHLASAAAGVALALAFAFWLERFDLLTDPSGAVYGAGYVDVHVTRWALWGAVVVSMITVPAVLAFAPRGNLLSLLGGVAAYGLIVFTLVEIVPGVFQDYVVAPNELELEEPYLARNIAATREAFQLQQVHTKQYRPKAELTRAELTDNQGTIDRIRLWDPRPLRRTFRQLQRIRTYYTFTDVDIDRYRLADGYRQVLLSARELAPDLPGQAQNWVNRHLQYTHGIGVAMADASAKGPGGSPRLMIKDLPPKTPDGLAIERPEIYYGEGMGDYRLVNTRVREFDYPKGDQNVYTRYAGHGGVKLDAGWKRALFALHQGSTSIFLTDYLRADSRIQFWRALRDRVTRLAPFLKLDDDPYLTIADGRLYWVQDAYTTASTYPYAEPYRDDVNYIRNSVKVVVDAYNGDVDLYVFEPGDPVVQAYRRAFPKLFQPAEAMPDSLRRHIRYPQDFFEAQVATYSTYHMTDPQVFYNREDVWTVPREKYAGEAVSMTPYYIMMRLPGDDRLEFMLMQPLTPSNRDNMIAWMAARSDRPHYGDLVVYRLPKERLTLGPLQIEAKIDQDTIISRQLSLWDQRGSQVIRGNLLVIPIAGSFLYVEPVYLLAEGTQIPQLKRVIVSDGEKLAMEPSLAEALDVVFGPAQRDDMPEAKPETARSPFPGRSDARNALSRAQDAMADGDWRAFGDAMQDLKEILDSSRDTPNIDSNSE